MRLKPLSTRTMVAIVVTLILSIVLVRRMLPLPGGSASGAIPPAPPGVPAFKRIFVITLENKEAGSVVGSVKAPYLNQLAHQYARASRYYAIAHPSLPNYLALVAGQTFGVQADCTDCFQDAPNLADLVERSGRSWKAYMEAMPAPCYAGSHGRYAQKHNPFLYFKGIREDPARCARTVPLDTLPADLAGGAAPELVWIMPDMCHSTHDCGLKTGDDWLARWVPQLLASPAWGPDAVLFITFDEGTTRSGCCRFASGGRVDLVAVSPLARPGYVSDQPYNHYGLLRTIEEAWGLPRLGHSDCECTLPLADLFAPRQGMSSDTHARITAARP